MKRLSLIVTVPLCLALAVFAVANRQRVALNLWPFFAVDNVPVFLLALGMLALGAIAGALWLWLPLTRWRLRARNQERRIAELEAALAENRAIVGQLRDARPAGDMLAPPR